MQFSLKAERARRAQGRIWQWSHNVGFSESRYFLVTKHSRSLPSVITFSLGMGSVTSSERALSRLACTHAGGKAFDNHIPGMGKSNIGIRARWLSLSECNVVKMSSVRRREVRYVRSHTLPDAELQNRAVNRAT